MIFKGSNFKFLTTDLIKTDEATMMHNFNKQVAHWPRLHKAEVQNSAVFKRRITWIPLKQRKYISCFFKTILKVLIPYVNNPGRQFKPVSRQIAECLVKKRLIAIIFVQREISKIWKILNYCVHKGILCFITKGSQCTTKSQYTGNKI